MTRTLGAGNPRDTVEIETPSRSSDVIGPVRPTSTTAAGWASESNVMRSHKFLGGQLVGIPDLR